MNCRRWLMALALCACGAAPAADKARPNIVVLVADDWGFSDVGSFGGEISTPHLDALAHRGTRFANFHTSASCSPTRSMLLTGVDNHLNGVGNLRETMPRAHRGKPGYLGSLNQRVVTVSTLLRDSGYRTYVSGKWNVGSEPHNLPDRRGFDRSIIQGDTGSDNWEPTKRYLAHMDKVYWFEDGRPAVMPKDFYSSEYFVDRAIEYIDSGAKDKKPFFAYLGFQANHVPIQAPRAFIDKYKGVYKDGWSALRQARRDKAAALGLIPAAAPMTTMKTTGDWERLGAQDNQYQQRRMEVYAGMADAMDHHVGRLVEHLKKIGEFDNTVFVFLSDNGPEGSDYYATLSARLWLDWEYQRGIDQLGAKGAYSIIGPSWASATAAPLDTFKFYAGEGGIRVPLIISGVPGTQPGQIQHSLAHVTDIVPTLLELAQVAHPGSAYKGAAIEPLRGQSLLAVITGRAQRVHAADAAIGHELSGNAALFKGDLKLVRNSSSVSDGAWHLYDITRDPGETRDLRDAMPAAFVSMQADYAAFASSHGVLPMPEGYDPIEQVHINTVFNYYLPTFGPRVLGALALLVAALILLRRRRRVA